MFDTIDNDVLPFLPPNSQHRPSNLWFIETVTEVLELGGDLVDPKAAHTLMNLIADGDEDDEASGEAREDAVENFIELLEKPSLPNLLLHVIAWVLGEYGTSSSSLSIDGVAEKVCHIFERPNVDISTRRVAISALAKLTARNQRPIPVVATLVCVLREEFRVC